MNKIVQLKENENNVYPITRGEVIFSGRTNGDVVCTKPLANYNCIEIITQKGNATRFYNIKDDMKVFLSEVYINPDQNYKRFNYMINVIYKIQNNIIKYNHGGSVIFENNQPLNWEGWDKIFVAKVIGYR